MVGKGSRPIFYLIYGSIISGKFIELNVTFKIDILFEPIELLYKDCDVLIVSSLHLRLLIFKLNF